MFAPNRRDFLKAAAALPLMPKPSAANPRKNCIFLMLVGGPSQLDTWDPKPDAPSNIRSPYQPIKTNVPGIEISEIFPRMARHADKYALIRSCYHDGEPVHEIGHQLIQTGHAFEEGVVEHPHIGSVISHCTAQSHAVPSPAAPPPVPTRIPPVSIRIMSPDRKGGGFATTVVLPAPIGNTGSSMPHGQTAGYLGVQHNPLPVIPPSPADPRYGRNRFGQSVAHARELIQSGAAHFVTVNMFETVFDQPTWDIHGSAPFSPLRSYQDHVAPLFDQAYSALLEDLHNAGQLENTLVVATGEFGRTPRINPAGGRDHWTQCWTMLMAGGGVQGGQIIGESDKHAAEPKDRPVNPAEIAATIYHAMGVDHTPWVDRGANPIMELFG